MSSAGISIADLRELIKKDLDASNELQSRIDQLHRDASEGKSPNVDQTLMNNEHKRIGKDLVLRIEQIEEQKVLEAIDREMLQALTARLSVHDLQSARLAQYRDLQLDRRSGKSREWLEGEDSEESRSRRRSANTQPILQPWAGMETTAVAKPTNSTIPDSPPGQTAEAASLSLPPNFVEGTEDFTPATQPLPATNISFFEEQSDDESEDNESDEEDEDDEEELEVDKATWLLLYQIIDIDPHTPDYLFQHQLDSRYRSIANRHDPRRFPNDPSASERWAIYTKVYEVLRDPERKKFYNMHQEMPKALEGLDLSKLSVSDDK